MTLLATVDTLDSITDWGRPFTVAPIEGTLVSAQITFPKIPAPESLEMYRVDGEEDWQYDPAALGGWSTFSDGASGQYGYDGPILHPSEFLGGGLAKKVLTTPGTYVLVDVSYQEEEEFDDEGYVILDYDPSGWVVLKKDEE